MSLTDVRRKWHLGRLHTLPPVLVSVSVSQQRLADERQQQQRVTVALHVSLLTGLWWRQPEEAGTAIHLLPPRISSAGLLQLTTSASADTDKARSRQHKQQGGRAVSLVLSLSPPLSISLSLFLWLFLVGYRDFLLSFSLSISWVLSLSQSWQLFLSLSLSLPGTCSFSFPFCPVPFVLFSLHKAYFKMWH